MAQRDDTHDYWTVAFSTGGCGNRHGTRRDAQTWAEAANRWSEKHSGERVCVALIHVRNHETIKRIPL